MITQLVPRMPVARPIHAVFPSFVEGPALSRLEGPALNLPKERDRAAAPSPSVTASPPGMSPSQIPPLRRSQERVPSCLGASHPRPKSAPPQPKSFLEKTLIRANPPHFAVAQAPEIGTPYHDAVRDTVAYKPTPDSL